MRDLTIRTTLVAVGCLVVIALGAGRGLAQTASSTSFRIPSQTLDLSSGKSTSSSYVLRGCLGAGPEAAGSASSTSYHVQIGCPQALSAGLPADDDDGDGVTSGAENGAPNNGDGNGDGIADSTQPNVASLPAASGRGYITVTVPSGDGTCSQLLDVHTVTPETLGGDAGFVYPFGMIGFTLKCDGPVQVTVIFHGSADLALPTTYRKFGHEAPNFAGARHFYTLPNVSFAMLPVGTSGEVALQATFTLTNGLIGDDTPAGDHTIIDPGAPAMPVPSSAVPALTPGLLAMLAVLLSVAGVAALRRRRA